MLSVDGYYQGPEIREGMSERCRDMNAVKRTLERTPQNYQRYYWTEVMLAGVALLLKGWIR